MNPKETTARTGGRAELDDVTRELQLHQIELEEQNRALRDAQCALEESRNRYADLYDFAPIAYCTLDERGCIREVNFTGASLLGRDRMALIGAPLLSVVRMDDPALFWRHIAQCRKTGAAVSSELSFTTADARSLCVQAISTPEFDPKGRLTGLRTALSDLSAHKLAERDRDLAWRAESTLRQQLERIDQAMIAVTTALAGLRGTSNLDAVLRVIVKQALSVVGAQYAARVYVFPGGPAGISATPTATLESNAASRFGAALAGAGDVDGDGRPEVVVGASGTEGERGRVYVYSSNATGLATTPTATLTGSDMPGRRFGLGVAMGDLNGDGHADVVAAERGASDDGSVFIFFGSRTGLPSTSSVTLRGDLDHTLEPAALGVGDLNGDGYADLAIGARSLATGSRFVLVYLGQAAGPTNIPSATIDALETERGDTQFGLGLELTGDVDSDGYTDLVIGAPLRGRAYLYRGGRPGVGTAPQATFDAGFDSGLGSAIAWIRRAPRTRPPWG